MSGQVWKSLCAASFAAPVLVLAACEEPPYPVGPQPRREVEPAPEVPAPAGGISETEAERILGAPPAELPAAEFYRQQVTGRWSERPLCAGMTWNFQAESFTTPGETHCTAIAVSAGTSDTIRVTGSQCTAEGAPQSNMALDVTVDGPAITVTGVGNPVSTPRWIRCG